MSIYLFVAINIYLSTSPGVTKLRGYKIRDAINPITITDLEPGATYYFIVTMVNALGESEKSKKYHIQLRIRKGLLILVTF
jgi:hypothetical protein